MSRLLPLPDRLDRWAAAIATSDPEAAREVREHADVLRHPERERFRKSVLRAAARIHCGGSRAAQARALAAAWAELDDTEHEVGSLPEMLSRLRRAGFTPLAARRITDLLDPGLD